MANGALVSGVIGLPNAGAAMGGGAIGAGVSDSLAHQGVPAPVAQGVGGLVGGYASGASAAFFSSGVPNAMGAALKYANSNGLKASPIGLISGIAAGATQEYLQKKYQQGCH